MVLDIEARRADFRALHKEGYFLLPTAWDVRSAKYLETLGFAGIASSIEGRASVLGRDEDSVTRDEVLAHLRELVNSTETAVNGDFGNGFASDPQQIIENVRLAIETGIAGLSISDEQGRLTETISRLQAARRAIDDSRQTVLLVARVEARWTELVTTQDIIKRVIGYSEAGADVLCCPGLSDPAQIKTVVETVAPKPVDISLLKPGMRAIELEELGVRRISVGPSFIERSWPSFQHTAQRFIDYGALPSEELRAA